MPPTARFRLLGAFDARIGDADPVRLGSGRAESLLAYLLLHPDESHSRSRLAALLWSDSTDGQALTNLRHLLHTLRARFPVVVRYLEIAPRTLRWRPAAPCWVDAVEFERLLIDPTPDRRTALRQAVHCYAGDLLSDLDDEWVRAERERLRGRFLDALAELAELGERAGGPADLVEAVEHVERLLRADPLREPAHRRLIRLHERLGDRARALRSYHRCASILERELGVEPAAETRALYGSLLPRATTPRAPGSVRAAPLIGRTGEQARLVAAWRAAAGGRAGCVLVGGEAGAGKSRLVTEFRGWVARQGAGTAEAVCYAAEGPLAYGPVLAWLRAPAVRARLGRLDRGRLSELSRLLPELRDEHPEVPAPEPEPVDERRRLLDAVAAALAEAQPLLLVLDDLQHADPETCRAVHYLLRTRTAARLLLVATLRTEDVDPAPAGDLVTGLRALDRLTEIVLDRLDPAETALLAGGVLGGVLNPPDAARLYAETEGNPLFVIEALRAGWAPGRTLGPQVSPRVQSVIADRLDRLGPSAAALLGPAAAIGREFGLDLLAAVTDLDADALVDGLDELWRRRIVRELTGDRPAGYDFTHDKLRQVAYQRLGPVRGQALHRRIAATLERMHAADPDPVSAQIAAHHDRGGAVGPAIDWYRRAALAAQRWHADPSGLGLLDRARALLRARPAGPARDELDLELHVAALVSMVAIDGYDSPGIAATHRQVRRLLAATGRAATPPLLLSFALRALTVGDFPTAARAGKQLRRVSERSGDAVGAVEAAYVLGVAAFWQVELDTARTWFERAVQGYRRQDRRAHLAHYGQDPKVVCLSRLANTLWFLDEPEAAVAARADALSWATEIEHPHSLAIGLTFAALLAVDMDDAAGVHDYTAALTALGTAGVHRTVAAALNGLCAVLAGEHDAGLARVALAVEEAAQHPAAPGQLAALLRVLLAAQVAAGRRAGVLAAAERLCTVGGAARLWVPTARRIAATVGPP